MLLSVAPGDRVAQLILERIAIADVAEVDDLDATYVSSLVYLSTACVENICMLFSARGAGGFGSTGVAASAAAPAAAAAGAAASAAADGPASKKHKL